jgi:hypothetical protein
MAPAMSVNSTSVHWLTKNSRLRCEPSTDAKRFSVRFQVTELATHNMMVTGKMNIT